jgi:hypothetical protein
MRVRHSKDKGRPVSISQPSCALRAIVLRTERASSRSPPALLRFLVIILVLCGLGYGGMWALVTFVKPEQREMRVVVPPEKYAK